MWGCPEVPVWLIHCTLCFWGTAPSFPKGHHPLTVWKSEPAHKPLEVNPHSHTHIQVCWSQQVLCATHTAKLWVILAANDIAGNLWCKQACWLSHANVCVLREYSCVTHEAQVYTYTPLHKHYSKYSSTVTSLISHSKPTNTPHTICWYCCHSKDFPLTSVLFFI